MSFRVWFESTKPKVYSASVGPVVIGTALAFSDGSVKWNLVPLILVCAVLIQLVSNWSNDVYDYDRGADNARRSGPRRVLVEGLIKPSHLIIATWIAAVICFLLGLILVRERGWIVLAIGVSSLVGAWMYTGSPYSFAYHGLGEAAALLFFGVLGVNGTYFIHAGTITATSVVMSVSVGVLIANILLVNNIRDVETDRAVGKRTLVVIIGSPFARLLYAVTTFIAIVLPTLFLFKERGFTSFIPLLTLFPAIWLVRFVLTNDGPKLNKALVNTGLLLLTFTLLSAVALLV